MIFIAPIVSFYDPFTAVFQIVRLDYLHVYVLKIFRIYCADPLD